MATNCPDFIKILRSAIIARTFSGDKNVSIFLGRPHRMQLGYVDINAIIACLQPSSEGPNDASPEATADNGWFDHSGDSWWTAICAMSKEQVMDLSREQDCELRSQKARYYVFSRFRLHRLTLAALPLHSKTPNGNCSRQSPGWPTM